MHEHTQTYMRVHATHSQTHARARTHSHTRILFICIYTIVRDARNFSTPDIAILC